MYLHAMKASLVVYLDLINFVENLFDSKTLKFVFEEWW